MLSLIKNRLEGLEADIIVMKGFLGSDMRSLSEDYRLLDDYIYDEDKILLENLDATRLLQNILTSEGKSICSCESFILLCNNVSNLEILGKRIVVLENNVRTLYPNPTTAKIPDFDSIEFETDEHSTAPYSPYYSYATRVGGEIFIQYIDNYSDHNQDIRKIPLIQPAETRIESTDHGNLKSLSQSDLDKLIITMYECGVCDDIDTQYIVDPSHVDLQRIGVLEGLGNLYGLSFRFFAAREEEKILPREELQEILKRVWGYDEFRLLRFYKNPEIDRELVEIPQNVIMEVVVRESEKALNGDNQQVNNVLLTAPTGAGKSLLFQLPAIFIAEKYQLLTIVISPLVALMDDQVEGMTGYQGSATLNSNKSATEKERILSDIRNGAVNILYISPELLLSYSIGNFIGDRRIGLFVVDEAHTVTTWGRDFRVDYLFLGDYIMKVKKVLGYTFPIFALTATAVMDPSGRNDMVQDTIRSLGMNPCLRFIGNVRRDNIKFEFKLSGITKNYEQQRRQLTIRRIREAIESNIKTLVYFPFRRTIDDIVFSDDTLDIRNKVASYYARMIPNIKRQNALDFKSGESPVMCATKAYGMGIDISDIQEVYHHAPSGNLSDYIQEIGRIARDPNIIGCAKVDFSPMDFRYQRRLHRLSTIKQYQLQEVLTKLMELYRMNGEKRNILISASDFSYIFPLSSPENLDQNLKSALLLISQDLLNKLDFHSIIVRPKSIFSKCYIGVYQNESSAFYRRYMAYLTKERNNVFLLDADRLWMEEFSNISFPTFKFKLNEGTVFPDFTASVKQKITLDLKEGIESTRQAIDEFFYWSEEFLLEMYSAHHRLKFEDMKSRLPRSWTQDKKERFVETFQMLYAPTRESETSYCRIYTSAAGTHLEQSFQLIQGGYESEGVRYRSMYNKYIKEDRQVSFVDRSDKYTLLCEFMNSLGIATYRREGGEDPVIFVRINNPSYLNYLVRKRNYENDLLNNIYEMHHYAERVFTYFFTTPMTDKERWDFIENYFLGVPEEELLR